MEPALIATLAAAVPLLAGLTAAVVGAARRSAAWRLAAQTCRLTDVVEEGATPGRRVLRGRYEDLRVSLSRFHRGRRVYGTGITIETTGAHTGGLQLRGESLRMNVRKMLGASELDTGDAAFDREFFIGGLLAPTLAFLDAETRGLLLHLRTMARVDIGGGCLSVEIHEGMLTDLRGGLPRALYGALEIARRWPLEARVPERLAHNALRDPEIGVRMNNLLALARGFEGHEATGPALRAAGRDPWPEIRLRAAEALGGPEGREALLTLTSDEADGVAARAVAALGRWLAPERAVLILERAMQEGRNETACACLTLLGRVGSDAAVARLVQVMGSDDAELKAAAAQALGWSGRPSAEACLLGALEHDVAAVQLAAAGALGQVGTAASVLPLKEAAERDSELRAMARQSIAAIQSRVAGAAPGQLSIAEGGEAGRLSLSRVEAGRLALKNEGGGK